MIVGLVGCVERIEPTFITLYVNGVVYGVHVSLRTSACLQVNQEVRLDTILVLRKDAQNLFGFLESEECTLFARLLKINGVGSRIALAILSVYSVQDFTFLLETRDLKGLQKVPGVGSKLAGKIMLDLEGYWEHSVVSNPHTAEAILALESLGFKSTQARQVCVSLPKGLDTQEIIKQALQQLR
ncbi:Holliday junction branch migration protein RuvA [Helicobacter salomonis]|uniref:Holliday junction branch migration protein RuvA n=1 Tax=Helicobacter salomonis TaxID=56878 RepID=UPI000CF0CD50|nr:Holliday junction branch migration protein RuvA [Helicobacter salomonis]